MFKYTSCHIVILALCLLSAQAAVIRNASEEKEMLETTTEQVINDELDVTTVESTTELEEQEFTTATPDTPDTLGALSRDEEATILVIDQTLLDPAPLDTKQSEDQSVQVEKFGKLLLLSTPKLSEKPKLLEETIEESEDLEEAMESGTDLPVETTTVLEMLAEETTTAVADVEEEAEQSFEEIPTTKLFPINDTLYEDNKKSNSQETQETPVVIVDEAPIEVKNSNLASVFLAETEADYVLVDADAELLVEGVYADVDSELHLQPIVQSLEIVPSSVDDTLLVNYVHSW